MTDKNAPKSKKTKVSIGRLILFLVAAFILVRAAVGLVLKHPKTEIVKYGEIEISDKVTGYVIKNEVITNSPFSGQLSIKVPEGTKVQKGITVASVFRDTSNDDYNKKIKAIDDQIANIKTSSNNSNLFQGDVQKLDQDITDKMKLASELSKIGNIDQLSDLKSQINDLISKRLVVNGEQGFSGSNIQNKIKERDSYVDAMNSSKVDISTSDTGILSFMSDGYEKYFTLNNLKSITLKDINKMSFKDNGSVPKKAQAGQPVVKVINNFEWYILCVMDTAKVKSLKQNDRMSIQLDDGTDIPARIYYIKDDTDNKSLVTLYLTTNLEQFYSLRKVEVKVVKNDYKGLKIPTSSIVYKDGRRGVIIVSKGITQFKEVDLVGFDDDFAIVQEEDKLTGKKGLSLYDEVVTNPRFIKEGVMLG